MFHCALKLFGAFPQLPQLAPADCRMLPVFDFVHRPLLVLIHSTAAMTIAISTSSVIAIPTKIGLMYIEHPILAYFFHSKQCETDKRSERQCRISCHFGELIVLGIAHPDRHSAGQLYFRIFQFFVSFRLLSHSIKSILP